MLRIDLYSNLGHCISKCYHDISDIVAEDELNTVLSDEVKKCQQYLFRGEVHVDFSGSNIDDSLVVLRNGLPRMMGGSYSSSPM